MDGFSINFYFFVISYLNIRGYLLFYFLGSKINNMECFERIKIGIRKIGLDFGFFFVV